MTDFALHPYQEKAAHWLAARHRGFVVSAAGSGKTVIAAAAIFNRWASCHGPMKIGWVAATTEQVLQGEKALNQFPEMLPFLDMRLECAAAQADWSDRDILVVDEFHHSAAPTWKSQIQTCKGTRWGITATPGDKSDRLDCLHELFESRYDVPLKEANVNRCSAMVRLLNDYDAGVGARIDAEAARLLAWRRPYWKGELWQLEAQVKWRAAIVHGIVGNANRTAAAVRAALEHPKNHVLMLVNEIEHGTKISDTIPGSLMCYSKMGAKKRRDSLDSFRNGVCRRLVATSLADEGLDLPMIDVVILVSGGSSKTKAEQRTGRALRNFAGKSGAIIYDFADTFHPFMRNQSLSRQRVYRSLGYEFEDDESPTLPIA